MRTLRHIPSTELSILHTLLLSSLQLSRLSSRHQHLCLKKWRKSRSIPHPLAWHFLHDSLPLNCPRCRFGKGLQRKSNSHWRIQFVQAASAMDETSPRLEEDWKKGLQREASWQVSDVLGPRWTQSSRSTLLAQVWVIHMSLFAQMRYLQTHPFGKSHR